MKLHDIPDVGMPLVFVGEYISNGVIYDYPCPKECGRLGQKTHHHCMDSMFYKYSGYIYYCECSDCRRKYPNLTHYHDGKKSGTICTSCCKGNHPQPK